MKTNVIKRLCLNLGLACALAVPSLQAQVALNFVRFQSENISDASLNYINIDALIFSTPTGVRIGIFNNTDPIGSASTTKPTVASIYFDGSPILSSKPTFNAAISSVGVEFIFGGAPSELPGGEQIGFESDSNFTATPPPPKNGLNPGEFAYFDFAGSKYNKVVAGIQNGSVRIGAHVLQIGANGQDSISMVTAIPEPTTAVLGLIGVLGLLRRRR